MKDVKDRDNGGNINLVCLKCLCCEGQINKNQRENTQENYQETGYNMKLNEEVIEKETLKMQYHIILKHQNNRLSI